MSADHKPISDDFAKEWHELVMDGPYFTMDQWMQAMGGENQQAIITAGESDNLVRKLSLKSSQGGYKVSLVWLPERMNIECANKLLKLIEEPPQQTVFIMVCEEPDKLLETIRSRVQRIDVKKDFGDGIVPGLSVSVYHSKEFYDDDKPSHVEAYEFVKERLSTEKIYAYVGKYESKRNIKLFVVSPYGFDKEVISLAEDKYIGLVLVNMNEEMSQESYIVQRSIEDYSQRQFNMDVLSGRHSMNSALMIYDAESG